MGDSAASATPDRHPMNDTIKDRADAVDVTVLGIVKTDDGRILALVEERRLAFVTLDPRDVDDVASGDGLVLLVGA